MTINKVEDIDLINRDISWLHFNARVLQEAADPNVPLLERLRFLGIFSNNLDEFFRVRYATIKRIDLAGKEGKKQLGGISAAELMQQITDIVISHQAESLKILSQIEHELEAYNVFMLKENELSEQQIDFVRDYYLQEVSPAIATLMLNDANEMPNLRDNASYLAVRMTMKQPVKSPKVKYALIEMPRYLKRFVILPKEGDKTYIIILDDLIRSRLHYIFSIFDYASIEAHMIKITRDAELDLDSDLSKSFLEKIYNSVQSRIKGDPVRFVYDKTIHPDTLKFLQEKMGIDNTDSIIPGGRYHNRRDYMKFPNLNIPGLAYKKLSPIPILDLEPRGSIFNKIKQKDYLLHAPYHPFGYVIKFLREAAIDPEVKTIKITIYRLAEISHVAGALVNAARNGKEVIVQIELQARFDEEANIKYAEQMQDEGVKLIFGIKGLKVHSKICVIHRIEAGKLQRYGFISTGNFNEQTAKLYTDFTLLTANQKILKDVDKVFNFLDVNYKVYNFKHLMVSPHYTRSQLEKLIKKEIIFAKSGKPAYIRLKLNSLSDAEMIEHLYLASTEGVKIDLIVRGICCSVPGIPGKSDNISIHSVVDRYLEHPRIFIFGTDERAQVFISSADFMTRNLDYRVEVGCPIYEESIKRELIDIFNLCWKDNQKTRLLNTTKLNEYYRDNNPPLRSQYAMYDYYRERNTL